MLCLFTFEYKIFKFICRLYLFGKYIKKKLKGPIQLIG